MTGWLAALRPDMVDTATGKIVKAETDDTLLVHADVQEWRHGDDDLVASPSRRARGAKIAVMGERGTLIAEHPGPNPLENGVVVASRDGAPLEALKTPAQYTPFTDARDHRLMAFRLLVRDFTQESSRVVRPPPTSPTGSRCQQVLDAVRESSASGRTVNL